MTPLDSGVGPCSGEGHGHGVGGVTPTGHSVAHTGELMVPVSRDVVEGTGFDGDVVSGGRRRGRTTRGERGWDPRFPPFAVGTPTPLIPVGGGGGSLPDDTPTAEPRKRVDGPPFLGPWGVVEGNRGEWLGRARVHVSSLVSSRSPEHPCLFCVVRSSPALFGGIEEK